MKEILDTMAGNIRKTRMVRDLSQEQLGLIIDTGGDYISKIESGRKVPSVATLLKIAKALGVPPGKLFSKGQKACIKKHVGYINLYKNKTTGQLIHWAGSVYRDEKEAIKNIDEGKEHILGKVCIDHYE